MKTPKQELREIVNKKLPERVRDIFIGSQFEITPQVDTGIPFGSNEIYIDTVLDIVEQVNDVRDGEVVVDSEDVLIFRNYQISLRDFPSNYKNLGKPIVYNEILILLNKKSKNRLLQILHTSGELRIETGGNKIIEINLDLSKSIEEQDDEIIKKIIKVIK